MDAGLGDQARSTPLALIEQLGRDGQVLHSVAVHAWPVRVGRGMACEVLLHDPHVAAEHAELHWQDGAVVLKLGQSINGARLGVRPLKAGEQAVLAPAQAWTLGRTRLRVRLADEALPAELALADQDAAHAEASMAGRVSWTMLVPWLALWLMVTAFDNWLDGAPGMPVADHLKPLLGSMAGVLAWGLLWALGNKLFEGHLNYLAHVHRALRYGLAMLVLSAALPMLAFMLDQPALSWLSEPVGLAVVGGLIAAHLALISPAHQRALRLGVASVCLVGWSLYAWFNVQRTGHVFTEQYVAALTPPAWRVAPTQPVQSLIQDAQGMKASLDRRAREDAKESAEDLGFDD
jgi:FHA domain